MSDVLHLNTRVSALLLTTQQEASCVLRTREIIGRCQGHSILQRFRFCHHLFQSIPEGGLPAFVQITWNYRFLLDPKQVTNLSLSCTLAC